MDRKGSKVEGFDVTPTKDFIWVVEFGQPDVTPGGIHLPQTDHFGKYRLADERFGRVIATGPGRVNAHGAFIPLTEPKVGDVVMFSRRHGSRLEKIFDGKFLRVLDTNQVIGIVEDFEPWWNPLECQQSPSSEMSG